MNIAEIHAHFKEQTSFIRTNNRKKRGVIPRVLLSAVTEVSERVTISAVRTRINQDVIRRRPIK